jgi:hypothetical protein
VADQTVTGPVQGAVTSVAGHQHVHHGRPASWIAISIIIVGFVVGGAAMLTNPVLWVLFWVGAGIVVVGGIMALSARVLDDWY